MHLIHQCDEVLFLYYSSKPDCQFICQSSEIFIAAMFQYYCSVVIQHIYTIQSFLFFKKPANAENTMMCLLPNLVNRIAFLSEGLSH